MKHLFWPQSYDIRNHLQEEDWKNYKYVEIEQHAMNNKRAKKRNQMENKTVPWNECKWNYKPKSSSCRNSCSKRGSSLWYSPKSRNKKNLKQSKFTPKVTRKRTEPQVHRKKLIIKMWAEINEIETKKIRY